MIHNFNEYVERRQTDSKKYDEQFFASDVIPMWIADTDFKSPKPVVDAVVRRAQDGIYGYTGISTRMKKAAQKWQRERFGFNFPAEAAEFVPGVIAGTICAVRALTRPGDKVIVHTPVYPPFVQGIKNNGRYVCTNALILKNGHYEVNFEEFEAMCRDPRTRVFILCNPHNPTGRVFTYEELRRMGDICLKYHVRVISDEIHSDIIYKGHRHVSFAGISQDFAGNCVTLINPSKTFNVPGFRTAAFIAVNPEIHDLVHTIVVSNKGFGENIFGTLAFCTCYEQCAYYADQLVDYLQSNLDLIRQRINAIPGMQLIEPEGTYLLWVDCRELKLRQLVLMDRMIHKAKVGIHDGLNFGEEGRGFFRINIGCTKMTLCEALDRIYNEFANE